MFLKYYFFLQMKTLNKFDISSFIAPMKANYDTSTIQRHAMAFHRIPIGHTVVSEENSDSATIAVRFAPGGLQKSFVSYTLPRYFVKIPSQNVKLHATILDFLPFSRFLITLHWLGKQISPSSKHVFPSSCSFWYHRLINLSEKLDKQMLKK